MKMRVFEDLDSFAPVAVCALQEQEAKHNLPLGILSGLQRHDDPGEGELLFALIEEDEGVSLVLLRTPPHNLIIAPTGLCSYASVRFAADQILQCRDIPGIVGLLPHSELFADYWAKATDVQAVLSMKQRIYRLTSVSSTAEAPGYLRRAARTDIPLLSDWLTRFAEEATPDESPPDSAEMARRLIDNQSLYLWVDGEPVSMAAESRPLRNTVAVNLVFTPEEKRRRGYATACVEAVSRRLLEQYSCCVLYADLANPASNAVYRKIGYEPAADSAVFKFVQHRRC